MPSRPTMSELEARDDFVRRHIGPGPEEIASMLETLGIPSLDALMDRAVPDTIRTRDPIDLPEGCTEADVLAQLAAFAARIDVKRSMIGVGYYDTITPPVIRRNVLENPGWYTAYTPYQPEISQGRLEALLNFQTMVSDLTGMEIANASMLDEATAAAEAMTMCRRVGKSKSDRFFVSDACHPQTIAVVKTRAAPLGIELVVGDHETALGGGDYFGALVQYPTTWGDVPDYGEFAAALHEAGGLLVVAADLLALTLLKPPGEWGADVVVGNTQRFGVPMGFGGPHAAYFATAEAHKRSVPGRIVGVSIDTKGRPALRLAMQTREQHIRREKATSNICTAQVLLAVMAGLYAVYHGPDGLRTIARRVHRLTGTLAAGCAAMGIERENETFFDTLTFRAPGRASHIVARARDYGVNLREIDDDRFGLSVDEVGEVEDIETLWEILADGAPGETVDGPRFRHGRGRRWRRVRQAPCTDQRLPRTPGVQPLSVGDRHAALSAPAREQGSGAQRVDDPARLVHHEAQRDGRDGGHNLARVRGGAPLRSARARPRAISP